MTHIANVYLPAASGGSIPMAQRVKPTLTWEPGVLSRENRDYAITVQADIVEGLQGATATEQLLPAMRALEARWTAAGAGAFRIEVAGAVQESGKCSASIVANVPIMLFITFSPLMLQLHSFSRAMLVFLSGPMGIAGVASALLLLNRPFRFVALLGMVQHNSVIQINQIDQIAKDRARSRNIAKDRERDRALGVHPWDAIVERTVRRLRPIVLTAAAAVLAMIPLSCSVFWVPMAIAIMGGLVVATLRTLLALRAMYAAF